MSGSHGVIFTKDRETVLLVKRRDIPIWVLPGGGIEKGETPEQAVIREVFEETGYTVSVVRKIAEYSYPNNKNINHSFECVITGGEKQLSNESKAIEEFNINQLPHMMPPFVDLSVQDALEINSEVIKKELTGFGIKFWLKVMLHPWALFKYLLTRIGIHWNT